MHRRRGLDDRLPRTPAARHRRPDRRPRDRRPPGPRPQCSQCGEALAFGGPVPRPGNDSGGGQPGWILKCKGWETDPDAYIYFIPQAPGWEAICDLIGKPEWK